MKYLFIASAVTALDQLTKRCAERCIAKGQSVRILRGKLRLRNTRNSGAALGLLAKNPRILAAMTAYTGISAFVQFRGLHKAGALDGGYKLAAACIAGGAAGNIADRVRRGYVTDIFQIGRGPIFNIADVCILFGVIVYLVKRLTSDRR